MEQRVIFTVLPWDALDDGGLRLGLFVSPRILPDVEEQPVAELEAFGNWPQTVQSLDLTLEWDAGAGTTGKIAPNVDLGGLRPDVWAALMSADPPVVVRNYQFPDLSNATIYSFPVQRIHALLRGLYQRIAEDSGGGRPSFGHPLLSGLGREAEPSVERTERDRRLDGRLADRPDDDDRDTTARPGVRRPLPGRVTEQQALADTGDAYLDLYQASRFFDPPQGRDPHRAKYPVPDPEGYKQSGDRPRRVYTGNPDFHEILGGLGDHPRLLEALGLVIPMTLPPVDATTLGSAGRLRVAVSGLPGGNLVAEQPWTRYVRDGQWFQPDRWVDDKAHGMLRLQDSSAFEVMSLDIDGAALAVEQRVHIQPALFSLQDDGVTPDLPSLRSGGLTVARIGRALLVAEQIQRAGEANAALGTDRLELRAEDVTRGYRVEVFAQPPGSTSGTWRSLMDREVAYRLVTGGDLLPSDVDQGFVKCSAMTSVPDAPGDDHYLHEALFGWDGWSLVVPRPGRFLHAEPKTREDPDLLVEAGERGETNLPLDVVTKLVPRTLPPLRYGWRYAFRVRLVDLAGHSVTEPDPALVTALQPYLRFEPVAPPALVPRYAYTEGESSHRLVIRSGAVPGPLSEMILQRIPAADYPAWYAANHGAAPPQAPYRDHTDRHLAPPKTSQLQAEQHGMFDAAFRATASQAVIEQTFSKARKEEGSFARPAYFANGASAPVPGHTVLPLPGTDATPEAEAQVIDALAAGDPPPPGWMVTHNTGSAVLPYLPDPMAETIWLRPQGSGLVEAKDERKCPLTGEWPELGTYRLRLVEGPADAPAKLTVSGRVAIVRMPPAGMARIRITSGMHPDGVSQMAIVDWLAALPPVAGPNDAQLSHADLARAGRHQMVTPAQDLVVVHAVQRPLRRPDITDLTWHRKQGQTFTAFSDRLRCHARSTGRIDVEATWDEWVDDPADERGPRRTRGRTAHAFDLTVTGWSDFRLLVPSLGDDPGVASGHTVNPDVADVEANQPPSQPPRIYVRQEFGDTKHRKVTYTPTATTRFREYFPPALSDDPANISVPGPAKVLAVPSSARPPAPRVVSVIPAFRWEPAGAQTPARRARSRFGGVRVYLERPWYVSGEDELLGVVLRGDGQLFKSDARYPYLTLWGIDPIRSSPTGDFPGGADTPRRQDFRNALPAALRDGTVLDRDLQLAELPDGPPVRVAAFPVEYNPDRGLWYADIELDIQETYWPFVRFAFVRFQPHSLEGPPLSDAPLHLSPVTKVDFVQLPNDRTAAVTRFFDSQLLLRLKVDVTGVGESHFVTPGPPHGVRVWFEQATNATGTLRSDLDWERPAGHTPADLQATSDGWSGLITPLPAMPTGPFGSDSTRSWRLVIEEYEALNLDVPGLAPGERAERVVYADHIVL